MKKLIILLLIIFSGTNIYGQTALPPAFEITSDTATRPVSLPDSNWQIMSDPTGKMTLQQVLQSRNFQDTNREIDYHINIYWLRYRYVNKMQQEAKIAVFGGARTDLYIKLEDGNWQHLKSGAEVPWSERDGLKRAISITTVIPTGKEITVYERDFIDYVYNAPAGKEGVKFNFTQNVIREKYTGNNSYALDILQTGLIIGILFLAAIINFFFFGIVHEKEYLYFALFLLTSAIMGPLSFLGDFFLKENPTLLLYITDGFRCFYLFFFIHFIRYFLKTFRRFPLWDKFLVAFSILVVLTYFFSHFSSAIFQTNLKELSYYLSRGALFGVALFVLITCLLYLHEHERSVTLFIVAVIPLMVFFGFITIIVFIDGIFHSHITSSSFVFALYNSGNLIVAICYSWMIIIFSWVLVRRFALIRRNLAEQKFESEKARSALIEQQKIELEKQVTERTSELQQSLENLKSTQKQLIQSEKMASLGELTAGIAHEIQNPLNFVNNFSDVNKELLAEMKDEILADNKEDAIAIANDVIENEQKINHHGKRADAIVKGMLQHSRVSTGQKEPTDINALADEYLRLSYHGLRAKDKSFNVEMKTDFDGSIGKINIIPQDIGRVLLNLFNNAFYAVNQQKTRNPDSFKPTVSVSTKKSENSVLITVSDNGNGIPKKIIDKIFQPFFTTKPTGEGTGLGLSLAYDIVKAHGGELKVETKENEGSEFVIQLPL